MGAITVATGTPLTWKNSGGTYVITLGALAAAAARQGAKGDLGATRAIRWLCRFTWDFEVAPVVGTPIEIWWSPSSSGTAATDNTGNCSGADAAYTGYADGSVAAGKLHLQLIGVAAATANADDVINTAEFTWYPTERYGSPVVVNGTAQAFDNEDAAFVITMTPLPESVA
jgi:hypothetical protein